MKKSLLLLTVFIIIFSNVNLNANNISVSNVSLEGQVLTDHYCLVEFDISWDNSWRTSSIPQNWDAAWVFIKFSVAGGDWQHAYLNSSGSVMPTGSTIDFPADTNGVFIYRDSDGTGTFSLTDVQLRWDYGEDGVADDASVEVKVFAIEMVYVPQGDFYLGDGNGAQYSFYEVPIGANPYLVSSDPVVIGPSAGQLYATGNQNPPAMDGLTVPTVYPVGYEAFYCMKYEMSQEQYVDFLNCLTRDQQDTRTQADVSTDAPDSKYVLSNEDYVAARNGVSCPQSGNGTTDPIEFYCNYNDNTIGNEADDGQNIACNFVSWMDVAAYADWAGLRPLTEPEYEKACRGPNYPVPNEYAYGTNTFHEATYTLSNEGESSEVISNMGTNIGHHLCASTSGFAGPARCGIFAASSTNHTRIETGASYFGIMEMSGNLTEMVVVFFNQAGITFRDINGDGELTTNGEANTDYWPGINGNTSVTTPNLAYQTNGVTAAAGICAKGLFYASVYWTTELSNRTWAYNVTNCDINYQGNGGRLARTAP